MRQKLEFQSDRIEAVLTQHGVAARVTGGTVTPRWVRFQVLPAVGAELSMIKGLSAEMAAALSAPNCRVSRRGAAVAIEVPRDDPQPVRLLPLLNQLQGMSLSRGDLPGIPAMCATLGLIDDGTPLMLRIPSPDVQQVMVAGTTGAGKTALLQSIILSLAMTNPAAELNFLLLDPKASAFNLFKGLPHLARPPICEKEEMIEALHSLVRLMERRSKGWASATTGQARQHVVVVIDELAALLLMSEKAARWALIRLTQRGNAVGIHVIAAIHKPAMAAQGFLTKANFPVRLVGRTTSVEDGRTATGWSGTGAERLVGQGDFLAVAEGRVVRFQTAHVSPEEIRDVVQVLAAGRLTEMFKDGAEGGLLE